MLAGRSTCRPVAARNMAAIAGIPELVRRLQSRGTAIFLVSGGFHAIIDPIAQHLGIPAEHVFANTILFKVQDSLLSPAGIQ